MAIIHFKILVRTPLMKQFDSFGPIATRGRSILSSVKYVDDLKNVVPPPRQNFLDLPINLL